MPRTKRKASKSDYYHVIMRGNNREWIFEKTCDKNIYYNMMKKYTAEYNVEICAWCIMDNHGHFLLKGFIDDVSNCVKKVNGCFAMKYNDENKRIGHVFQDRFKSETIEDRQYYCGLIRYIHNNPVKAGMVIQAGEYAWSSYNEYFEEQRVISENSVRKMVGYFGGLEGFQVYHYMKDTNEYLDVIEEMIAKRNENAKIIIKKYCDEKKVGINDFNSIDYQDLVERLLRETKLTSKNIAEILNISINKVYYIRKNMMEKVEEGIL